MNIPLAGRQSFNAISYTETNLFFCEKCIKITPTHGQQDQIQWWSK